MEEHFITFEIDWITCKTDNGAIQLKYACLIKTVWSLGGKKKKSTVECSVSVPKSVTTELSTMKFSLHMTERSTSRLWGAIIPEIEKWIYKRKETPIKISLEAPPYKNICISEMDRIVKLRHVYYKITADLTAIYAIHF